MEIVEFKKEHEAEYAITFKNAYFPYTLGFKKFVEALGYETMYLLVIHDAKIINAICLSKVGGSAYTPFGFCGGAINSRYISELYSKAKELAKHKGCYELAVVSPPMMNVQLPSPTVEWRFAQITHLPSLVYPRTIRKEINKASKLGFDIEVHTKENVHNGYGLVNEFADLCKTNIDRKDSTTHDVKFIKAVLENLNSSLWICSNNGELRASTLIVQSSGMIDYFMVGQIVDEEKRKYALEWLIHNIIECRKAEWMNWQGSCDSGTEFFKARFRAEKVWYPVFKHPLVEQKEVGLLDKLLRAGVRLGEFWLGKMR